MPYIKQEQRAPLLPLIEELAKQIKLEADKTPRSREGIMNFCVYKLIKLVYGENLRYADHNDIIGFMDSCKEEWRRRNTNPYEDSCISRNGDV